MCASARPVQQVSNGDRAIRNALHGKRNRITLYGVTNTSKRIKNGRSAYKLTTKLSHTLFAARTHQPNTKHTHAQRLIESISHRKWLASVGLALTFDHFEYKLSSMLFFLVDALFIALFLFRLVCFHSSGNRKFLMKEFTNVRQIVSKCFDRICQWKKLQKFFFVNIHHEIELKKIKRKSLLSWRR